MLDVRRCSESRIELWGEADLTSAQALHAALLEVLDAPGTVTLDLFGLEEIELATLQILVAFVKARGRDRVTIAGCPETLARRIRLAGLSEWIVG